MNTVRIRSSAVLTAYIQHRQFPAWTAFYIKKRDIVNDQFGLSNFNWKVDGVNYHILRTGCYPFVKYHCTKAPYENLQTQNLFYGSLKLINFGIPLVLYGLAGLMFANHREHIVVQGTKIELRFWYEETW
jgi:hypothetical protein